MSKVNELREYLRGKIPQVFWGGISIGVAIVLLIVYFQNRPSTPENLTQNTYSESDKKIALESRRKKRIELSDKYENLIKQNRNSIRRTIEVLTSEGFTLFQTDRFSGSAVMYHYSMMVDGFKVIVTYMDSPNPMYNEVLLNSVEDMEIRNQSY